MKKWTWLTLALLAAAPLLAGSVTVTAPNGGETWCLNDTRTITWTHSGASGVVRIVLFNGSTKIGNIAVDIPATAGSYSWVVGSWESGTATPGTEYKIRIRNGEGDLDDWSNAAFTIKAAGECGSIPRIPHEKWRVVSKVPWWVDPNPPDPRPEFDIRELRELLGDLTGPLTLALFKNGQLVQKLGSFGKGQRLPTSLKGKLGQEDFGLLKSGGAKFEIGVLGPDGQMLNGVLVGSQLTQRLL